MRNWYSDVRHLPVFEKESVCECGCKQRPGAHKDHVSLPKFPYVVKDTLTRQWQSAALAQHARVVHGQLVRPARRAVSEDMYVICADYAMPQRFLSFSARV
jgi:hypothetical protein